MKKAVFFILVLVISISAFAEKYPVVKPEGEGTQESPYLFKQIENFGWIADQRDNIDAGTTVYCVQINDIDATETENWRIFPDILTSNINGEKRGSWFLNYDGQGFSIENLCLGFSGTVSALFATGNFQLKNINVVRAKSRVFEQWTAQCNGILVGYMGSGYIKNCHIRETSMHANAALIDQLFGSNVEISDCSVDVELKNAYAGLVNFVRDYGTVVIKNTSVKAKITLDTDVARLSSPAGFIRTLGIEEEGQKTVIEDCYSDVEISTPNNYVSFLGFIGDIGNERYDEKVDIAINRCYSTVAIKNTTPARYVRSFIGFVTDCEPTINDCYYNACAFLTPDKYALPKTEEEMKQQATFENWDFEKVWAIDEGNGFPYLRSEIPEEYPELNVNYKGQGECKVDNGVVTVTGGSEKDTLTVFSENGKCRVKRIVADNGLKKIKVAGDLEGLQVAGKVGSLLVNGGDLGKEGKDFALIFDADQATIKVKAAKQKAKVGSKAGEQVVGGNVKGNILCGTRNESGKITTLGTVKKLVTLGGNIENGKLVAGKVNQVSAKPKAGKGGKIIDFKTETN